MAQQNTPVEPPEPINSGEGEDLESRLSSLIDQRVQKIQSQYDKKIAALENRYQQQLKAARGVPPVDHYVPEHAGGAGTDLHPSWGQYYQELSARGELTDAHIRASHGLAPEEPEDDDDSEALV
jgi:hypothetical protein